MKLTKTSITFVILFFITIWLGTTFKTNSIKLPFTKNVHSIDEFSRGSFSAIPSQLNLNKEKVDLGKKLFFDSRLSADNTVSCSFCHQLDRGGADNAPKAIGIYQLQGKMNTPTIFNSVFNFRQFWNGRANTLFEQIEGPINGHSEMDSNWEQIISKLESDAIYIKMFKQIYKGKITSTRIKETLVEFEKSLTTPNSKFDNFLHGDSLALTKLEQQGFRLFQDYGCSSCHQGVNLGGNLYEKIGVIFDYYDKELDTKVAELSRFGRTGIEEHRFEFKVPGLRNVAITAPYFHDGSIETLEQAVELMAYHQIGIRLSHDEIKKITAFLETLTGEYNGSSL